MTPEAVARVRQMRSVTGLAPALVAVADRLSPAARGELMRAYPELAVATVATPDAWIVTARGHSGSPPATAVVQLRLEAAGPRAAIVRRRSWIE
jgi:hypothetical protein